MNKWYFWLFLSVAFTLAGVINYFDGKQIIGQIIQVLLTVFLAFLQLFCEKKGGRAIKIFPYLSVAIVILLVAATIFILK